MVSMPKNRPAILIIDDEESMREGCRQTLEENGYTTCVAGDGEEGLLLLEQMKPLVALVDLKMPGIGGMEVLSKIQELDAGTASIVITGYGSTESAVVAMKLGACDFLCKPFDGKVLLDAVDRGIEQGRKLRLRDVSVRARGQTREKSAAAVRVQLKSASPPVCTVKALDARGFGGFVNALIAGRTVVGAKAKDTHVDRFVFGPLQDVSELRLDYDVTLLPPKKYLLPVRETLVTFELGDSPAAEPCIGEPQPMALIGVHPYDMIALNQLDRVMSEGNPDPNYRARRERLTIIGSDPVRANENAFWKQMGCEHVEDGFDLWLTDIGGTYLIEVGTERGEALLAEYGEAREATKEELILRAKCRKIVLSKIRERPVKFRPEELPGLLRGSFNHPVWKENAQECLSCGSCNLLCPTCYCFDVRDTVDISMTKGERYRVWDGCVLEDFARVGTGENFREERFQRYRHRFYRKGMYLYDRYGLIACVGCGRCVAACLPGIADPVKVYNTLKEEAV